MERAGECGSEAQRKKEGFVMCFILSVADSLSFSCLGRECTQPPKEKSCYRCGMTGHISRECPSSGSGDNNYSGGYSGGSGGQECYKCGQVGHIARNCSQQGGSGYGGGYGNSGSGSYSGGYGGRSQTCYSCGGYGHMARGCTQGQKCYNCMLPCPKTTHLYYC